MPLKLDIKKKLSTKSERVKSVCVSPTDHWVLSGLYNGKCVVYNFETHASVQRIDISAVPVRCAIFVIRMQWIITAGDDMCVRVYDINTSEKIQVIDAHSDYIRFVAAHSTLPYLLSSSDDMTIRLWDWSKNWQRICTYECHTHYVMMVAWNPRDSHIFASASLDRSIKVWSTINSSGTGGVVSQPHFTLLGHERGVNSISYSTTYPYLLSGSDDMTVRVWDYQTKQCLHILTGHSKNVSCAVFHPNLPLIMSGSEDGTLKIWHSLTFRLENTLNYNMERLWSIHCVKDQNVIALGYDEGTVVIKLGSDVAVASMLGGKIFWAKATETFTANVSMLNTADLADGERLNLAVKELGISEMFSQSISHHPSGRFFALCGDGEYVIYTSQAFRTKKTGSGVELVWSPEGHYAVRTEGGDIIIFKEFEEAYRLRPSFTADSIFGGRLLGVGCNADFVCFYDWDEYRLIRRIDVSPTNIWWSESGSYLSITTADSVYILQHDKDAVAAVIAVNARQEEEGIEIAFNLLHEIPEKIQSGIWVSDSFIFITNRLRIQVYGGDSIEGIGFVSNASMSILGYHNNRLYLVDREFNFVSYFLHRSFLDYQSAIIHKDFNQADICFKSIPESLYDKVARFLDNQGLKEQALSIAKDNDHRIELALSLQKLYQCSEIINEISNQSKQKSQDFVSTLQVKWRQLGDAALESGDFELALQAFHNADDCDGMLLILSSIGDVEKLEKLALSAKKSNIFNVAVLIYVLLQRHEDVLQILRETERFPEAALYARTYCPSLLRPYIELWKQDLARISPKFANALVDPFINPQPFQDFELSLKVDPIFNSNVQKKFPDADQYSDVKHVASGNILDRIQQIMNETNCVSLDEHFYS